MSKSYDIRTEDGDLIGRVQIATGYDIPLGDFAITPVTTFKQGDPDSELKLSHFLASPRSTLRRSPRSKDYPFEYEDSDENNDERNIGC